MPKGITPHAHKVGTNLLKIQPGKRPGSLNL